MPYRSKKSNSTRKTPGSGEVARPVLSAPFAERVGFGFPITRLPAIPRSRAILRFVDYFLQFDHLQRTLRPVVLPAHNQVAFADVVIVFQKVQAPVFQLDVYPLPFVWPYLAHRLAVWIPSL